MLKPILLLSAASLLVFAPLPTLGSNPQSNSAAPAATAGKSAKPAADSLAKAKNLYQLDCAMCHGDNGNGQTDVAKGLGATMPDFTDAKSLEGKSDADLFAVIRNGKDKMPPEASGRANDAMVQSLIAYIRGMAKGTAATPAQ